MLISLSAIRKALERLLHAEAIHYIGGSDTLPPPLPRRFENTGVNIEDLISIGTIGLIKAINTFNSGKAIKLATYASRCIENEILMYLRKNNAVRGEISIDEPLNTDYDGNELLLSDILGTDADEVIRPPTARCCASPSTPCPSGRSR